MGGMEHIMLDLETMGKGSTAAIIAIGAVYFNEEKLGKTFYEKVSLESSMKIGMQVSASTILWWLKQSEEARQEIYSHRGYNLPIALDQFKMFCGTDNDIIKIWGNGSDFDNVILRNAYFLCEYNEYSIPWKYTGNRDFRTIKNLFVPSSLPETKGEHCALSDATWQAEYMIRVCQEYKLILK